MRTFRRWVTRIGNFKFANCTGPTAVKVSSFAARWRGRTIDVRWRTAAEADTLGFNIYRSIGNGPFRRLNRRLIAAKRGSQTDGAKYSLVDRNLRGGATYTYRLQIVSMSGARSWHGIGTAAVG